MMDSSDFIRPSDSVRGLAHHTFVTPTVQGEQKEQKKEFSSESRLAKRRTILRVGESVKVFFGKEEEETVYPSHRFTHDFPPLLWNSQELFERYVRASRERVDLEVKQERLRKRLQKIKEAIYARFRAHIARLKKEQG